nr:sulfatase-like hydrolase/transferase [Vibrio mexicanus]
MNDTQQPNVIIIYADDLGFGDVSCYGANDIPTPNLDKLADQGIKFHQAMPPQPPVPHRATAY